MRWWAGAWMIAGMVALAACGTSAGGGSTGATSASASGSSSARPSPTAPTGASATPSGGSPSESATAPSTPAGNCAAGHTEISVAPGDAVHQRLCVRPGTVISLVLRPRTDDRRWMAVHSSAPALVLASAWRLDPDGTARASLRCAGTRGGTAEVTALAKAPDIAGAARAAFTLQVSVVPYTTQG
ncbi:hypothetical protein GCM10022403_007450 [Streptomyces coacervatus]|uniref:Lipoprotein n=1 Tax=Streptomyces coacervatus TaxID=647381 RepID=A0ABP7GSX6_9ACTN|nr:hypothetical protein [Streptomyces coacervatus]MDF2268480.1 hypothetical protein [Streptomyces coacervatus]